MVRLVDVLGLMCDVLGKVKGVRSTSRLRSKCPIGRRFYAVSNADRATREDCLYAVRGDAWWREDGSRTGTAACW